MATKEELETLLKEAREKIKEQNDILVKLTSPPLNYVPVIAVTDQHVIVGGGGGSSKLMRPDIGNPKPGDFALVNAMTKGIVDFEEPVAAGQTHTVRAILDEKYIEIANPTTGEAKVALYGIPVEAGDMVLLDSSSTVVIRNFGRPPSRIKPFVDNPTTWGDIGGLDNLKDWFRETLESPFENQELYAFYNLAPPKGVLMCGPPGCGKTLIAKAVANSINHSIGGGFINIKGPEVLAPLVGVAEQTIRDLFKQARDFKIEKGFPAIIFIDEAEAILNRRGTGRSSDVDRTIVPAFLAEMDGMEETGAIVLLATNRPETLDPAVIREGRIDKKVFIPRPSVEAAINIFRIHLSRFPLAQPHSPAELAEQATTFTFKDSHILAELHYKDGEVVNFLLKDILSGAMIATVCQMASQLSFARDLKAKKPVGLTWDTLELAIRQIRNQNSRIDHVDAIKDMREVPLERVIKSVYEEVA